VSLQIARVTYEFVKVANLMPRKFLRKPSAHGNQLLRTRRLQFDLPVPCSRAS
jgi:hypothetical protein